MLTNELSLNTKCGQSVTTTFDRRTFTNVLGANEDKVPRDQTLSLTHPLRAFVSGA